MQFVQSAAEINENTARMVNITPQTLNNMISLLQLLV